MIRIRTPSILHGTTPCALRYALLTDQALIDRWKYHQLRSRRREDGDWIAFSVCEDLLRQRGNPYLDNHYPKD